jgi:outer membrane protein TolC
MVDVPFLLRQSSRLRWGPRLGFRALLVLAGLVSVLARWDVQAQPSDPSAATFSNALPPVVEGKMELSSRAVLQLAVERNAQVLLNRMQSEIARELVAAESALYDPLAFSGLRREYKRRQRTADEILATLNSPNPQEFEIQSQNAIEAGVRKRVATGGELGFSVRTNRRRSNLSPQTAEDPEERAALVLTVRQPLMRGFGRDVVETDLRVAELEAQVSRVEYLQQIERVGAEALTAYWQLARALDTAGVLRRSRDGARSLLADVESRIEIGRVAPLGAIEARSALLLREAELARTEQTIFESEARIRALLRLEGAPSASPFRLAPTTALRGFDHRPDVSEAALQRILERWPALRIATLRRDQALVRLNFAADQRRPNVEFQASYSTNGQAYDFERAWEIARGTRYPDWFVGVNMEMPLMGHRRASAQFEAQTLRVRQSEEEMRAVRTGLTVDLLSRVEQLAVARDEVARLRAEVDLRARLVEIERMQLGMGISRVGQVLEREKDFVESSVRRVEAEARIALLLTGIMLADGSLFPIHAIEIEE